MAQCSLHPDRKALSVSWPVCDSCGDEFARSPDGKKYGLLSPEKDPERRASILAAWIWMKRKEMLNDRIAAAAAETKTAGEIKIATEEVFEGK